MPVKALATAPAVPFPAHHSEVHTQRLKTQARYRLKPWQLYSPEEEEGYASSFRSLCQTGVD